MNEQILRANIPNTVTIRWLFFWKKQLCMCTQDSSTYNSVIRPRAKALQQLSTPIWPLHSWPVLAQVLESSPERLKDWLLFSKHFLLAPTSLSPRGRAKQEKIKNKNYKLGSLPLLFPWISARAESQRTLLTDPTTSLLCLANWPPLFLLLKRDQSDKIP